MKAGTYLTALLLIGAAAAPSLVEAWRDSPYAEWGWLAFLLWLPSCLQQAAQSASFPAWAYRASVLLAAAGALADVNALNHAALAVVLAGFCRAGKQTWFCLAMALCWIPAGGYGSARLGFDPRSVSVGCLLAAAWSCVVCCLRSRNFGYAQNEALHG